MNKDALLKLLDLGGVDAVPDEPGGVSFTPTAIPPPAFAYPTALDLDDWGLRRGKDLLAESERIRRLGLDADAAADFPRLCLRTRSATEPGLRRCPTAPVRDSVAGDARVPGPARQHRAQPRRGRDRGLRVCRTVRGFEEGSGCGYGFGDRARSRSRNHPRRGQGAGQSGQGSRGNYGSGLGVRDGQGCARFQRSESRGGAVSQGTE